MGTAARASRQACLCDSGKPVSAWHCDVPRTSLVAAQLGSGRRLVDHRRRIDAEYRYLARPLAALQSLDRYECVVYVGTFTKMLFNSLRLGFLVLPSRLVDPFAAARSFTDRHPPTLDQAILAEFILDGHFGHHVRRMRQANAERTSAGPGTPPGLAFKRRGWCPRLMAAA